MHQTNIFFLNYFFIFLIMEVCSTRELLCISHYFHGYIQMLSTYVYIFC
jgi:hypothetical protein